MGISVFYIPENGTRIVFSVKHPMAFSQGLLHSPTDGTYPPGLVWDTSCPIYSSLLLVAMQDILRGVLVNVTWNTAHPI